jgi:hypothetical protein
MMAEMAEMAGLLADGSPSVAIRASHFATRELSFERRQGMLVQRHDHDALPLRPDVIELQHD